MIMGDLIKRLLDEAFDTNTTVSIAGKMGDQESHFMIDRVEVVEDDSEETGHRLVLYAGETVDSYHRLVNDLRQVFEDQT